MTAAAVVGTVLPWGPIVSLVVDLVAVVAVVAVGIVVEPCACSLVGVNDWVVVGTAVVAGASVVTGASVVVRAKVVDVVVAVVVVAQPHVPGRWPKCTVTPSQSALPEGATLAHAVPSIAIKMVAITTTVVAMPRNVRIAMRLLTLRSSALPNPELDSHVRPRSGKSARPVGGIWAGGISREEAPHNCLPEATAGEPLPEPPS